MSSVKKHILIVEDNEDNCVLIEKILNYYGYKTSIAPTGKAALELCSLSKPDLILMDLSLPDIDGIELTNILRSSYGFQKIPIVALTAHALPALYCNTQEMGLDDILTKPFLPPDLLSIVKKHLT